MARPGLQTLTPWGCGRGRSLVLRGAGTAQVNAPMLAALLQLQGDTLREAPAGPGQRRGGGHGNNGGSSRNGSGSNGNGGEYDGSVDAMKADELEGPLKPPANAANYMTVGERARILFWCPCYSIAINSRMGVAQYVERCTASAQWPVSHVESAALRL